MLAMAREVLADALASGFERAEVFSKSAHSRRFELERDRRLALEHSEAGWALRAGDDRRSLFFAASGDPQAPAEWPRASRGGLLVPPCVEGEAWVPDEEGALVAESEAVGLLARLAATVAAQGGDAHFVGAFVENGHADVAIVNSNGIDVAYGVGLAVLRVEASLGSRPPRRCTLHDAAHSVQLLDVQRFERRLQDLLLVQSLGRPVQCDGGPIVLSSAVTSRLLAALAPLFLDETETPPRTLAHRDGRIAAEAVTLIDDGRLRRGVYRAPVDGEGVPTGVRVLIDAGQRGEMIRPWSRSPSRAVGCRIRAGWRDLPRTGASHLYLLPREDVSPSSLRSEGRYYVLQPTANGIFDVSTDRFSLPVCGFEIADGEATLPFAGVALEGELSTLLHGVRGMAADLEFHHFGTAVGAPTVLVDGLALRPLAED